MWNAATFQRVYDTGDDMEREASRATNGYSTTFNGECSNVNLSPVREADLRSDNYVCYELGLGLWRLTKILKKIFFYCGGDFFLGGENEDTKKNTHQEQSKFF